MERGYFGIGVWHPKTDVNVGTLWRSASSFGAAFIFTVGRRYKEQASDTGKSRLHTPLFHFDELDDLLAHLPHACPLVGLEEDDRSRDLRAFTHPERACYLLGAEDHGLPSSVMDACHHVLQIEGASMCLNVAVAGSIVLWDRVARGGK